MAYSDLDDVDYLVEDNVMDEFAYHRKWKRPIGNWHNGVPAGNKMQMLGMFQPSYLPEIQIWLVSGHSRLIKSRKRNESLQHKLTR